MNNSRSAHTIVIGNEKGGSGKSTTAIHIAVGLMTMGYRVATIDVDGRQGTLSRYIANRDMFNKKMTRDYPTPTHHRVESHAPTGMNDAELEAEAKRLELIIEAAGLHSDVLIIDTPGAANRLSFLAHTYADTLITPLTNKHLTKRFKKRIANNESIKRSWLPYNISKNIESYKAYRIANNYGSVGMFSISMGRYRYAVRHLKMLMTKLKNR